MARGPRGSGSGSRLWLASRAGTRIGGSLSFCGSRSGRWNVGGVSGARRAGPGCGEGIAWPASAVGRADSPAGAAVGAWPAGPWVGRPAVDAGPSEDADRPSVPCRVHLQGPGIPGGPPLLDMRVVEPFPTQDLTLLVPGRGVVLGDDPKLVLRGESATLGLGAGSDPTGSVLGMGDGCPVVPSQAETAERGVSSKAGREGAPRKSCRDLRLGEDTGQRRQRIGGCTCQGRRQRRHRHAEPDDQPAHLAESSDLPTAQARPPLCQRKAPRHDPGGGSSRTRPRASGRPSSCAARPLSGPILGRRLPRRPSNRHHRARHAGAHSPPRPAPDRPGAVGVVA